MGIFKKTQTGVTNIVTSQSNAESQPINFSIPNTYVQPSSGQTLSQIIGMTVSGLRRLFSTSEIPTQYGREILKNALSIDLNDPLNPIHRPQVCKINVTGNLPTIARAYVYGIREIFVCMPGKCYLNRITFPGTVASGGIVLFCIYDTTGDGSKWNGWSRWEVLKSTPA